MEDGFEKTNLVWQIQQLQRQFGEWLEVKLAQPRLKLPDVSFPDWIGRSIFWVILGFLIAWIGWQLWQLLDNHAVDLSAFFKRSSNKLAKKVAPDLTYSEWLRRSQIFYRQGNYTQACRALYLAMLQRLHDTGIALHQKSRTDGEYRQLTEQLPQKESYNILLTTHEQIYFANQEMSLTQFEQCQQAYREIAVVKEKSGEAQK